MTKYNSSTPPPSATLPIIQKLIVVYKIWHGYLPHFPKTSRYTLGLRIDSLFTETIENIFIASHRNKTDKAGRLNLASDKFDLLKFFLQIAWEIRSIDNKKYIALSEKLNEIGKMLGGWQKQTQTPYNKMGL